MTSANIPIHVRGHGADGPDPAHDTGKDGSMRNSFSEQNEGPCALQLNLPLLVGVPVAGLGEDPIQGIGGGLRVHGRGDLIPGIEAVAVDLGQYLCYCPEDRYHFPMQLIVLNCV